MDAFIEFCQSWTMGGIATRLFLATLAGVIIGMDREYKNKGAGIKTHALVCIGAALSMIVNEFILRTFPASNTDLARMGAQVISGVGFLGVGTIIVTGRNEVKGLTTAAGLWACAGIGLAAGIGFIKGTLLALLFVIIVLRVLEPMDKKLRARSKDMDIYVEFQSFSSIRHVLETLRQRHIRVSGLNIYRGREILAPAATLSVKMPRHGNHEIFLQEIGKIEGILHVEEI
ncbi:MgtC/SapB family protein [uncultured Dialister sp.]|uniref:MgtC/SapB family protein n=1 Tax=uncultured Dialister sp. TaxID=278064 RepID=UPI0026130E3B|nr:MgtC/SapB family protein [uncultured Dialister sp.]